MFNFSLISSVNNQHVIGIDNSLYIESKDDLRRFYKITTHDYTGNGDMNLCIMGYNTWMSIPENIRPFPKRINIILTKNHCIKETDTIKTFGTFEEALYWSSVQKGKTFVIGGESLFQESIQYSKHVESIYLTHFHKDTDLRLRNLKYFPSELLSSYELIHESIPNEVECTINKGMKFEIEKISETLCIYQRKEDVNHSECQYLQLMNKILKEQNIIQSRNSKVYSSFGEKLEFDLADGFPLLTTKKMGYKTILRELLWFLKGSTDNQKLKDKNVHIWDQNASREFLDSRGLDYNEDDLGPIYGFQWRHFGAKYIDSKTNYENQGIDQIKQIIHQIQNEPESRRIILSAWNPLDLDKMALPPCHVMCQFNVNQNNNTLNCQLYQRSGDMFLGVPFNIASYSFLTSILAHLTNLKPGKFIHILGDAHIYESHLSSVKQQIIQEPKQYPQLVISEELKDIDMIQEDYFQIQNYESLPKITAPMIA